MPSPLGHTIRAYSIEHQKRYENVTGEEIYISVGTFHCTCINLLFHRLFFYSFFFKLIYSRLTSSLPSCLWSQRIFKSLPGSRLTIFLSRCKFSTLTTRQPMVDFYLHVPTLSVTKERTQILLCLVKIELTTSALAGVQVCRLPIRPLGRQAA